MGRRFNEFKMRAKAFGERHRLTLTAGAALAGSFLGNLLFSKLRDKKANSVTAYQGDITFPFETEMVIHPYADVLDEKVNDDVWETIRDTNHDRAVKFASTLNLCDGESVEIYGPGCFKWQNKDEYVIRHFIGGD